MDLTIGSLLGMIALIGITWIVGWWGWRRWTRPLSALDDVRHEVRLERERQKEVRRASTTGHEPRQETQDE